MSRKDLRRILLVEDEEDIREVAQMALEAVGGFTVETAGSGAEALEKATALPPDLVLMDCRMPVMDGPTAFRAMRERRLDVPVIFMTASVQDHEVAAYTAMGAMGVIAKPFDPLTLSETAKRIWEEQP
jgi:CheY-like chemotaxis protein